MEDQLAAIRILSYEAASTRRAVNDAATDAANRNEPVKTGFVNFLNVVNAQTTLLYNQRTQTAVLGEQMVASVALVKALGGGWTGLPKPPAN